MEKEWAQRAGIGWIVGSILSGMFALAMAQISSAFPTAGGLYHWGSILGGRAYGWVTAWFNLLGLIFVVASLYEATVAHLSGLQLVLVGTTVEVTRLAPVLTTWATGRAGSLGTTVAGCCGLMARAPLPQHDVLTRLPPTALQQRRDQRRSVRPTR